MLSSAVDSGCDAVGNGAAELREDAAPVDPRKRRQPDSRRTLAMPGEPHVPRRASSTPPDHWRGPSAEESQSPFHDVSDERLGPRPL